MLLSVGSHTCEDQVRSLVSHSRNTATAEQLEVDFSIVTLSGHIWEDIRYAVAKEEVYYLFNFAVSYHHAYTFRWTILIIWHF